MKSNTKLFLIMTASIILVSCQALFTFSPLADLQRPFSELPIEQQINRANDALASGDPELMREAYNVFNALLAEEDNPEMSLLAADLAFGASGIADFFAGMLSDPESAGSEDLEALLGELDTDLIIEGAFHIQNAADSDVEISDNQYLLAGAALLAAAVDFAGGFDALDGLESGDPGFDDYQDAQGFLEAGGAADLLEMFIDEEDIVTYVVVYDGNGNTGGNVPIDTNNYESGNTVTVLENSGSLGKTGNTFIGWNTSSDGSGIDRAAGTTFPIDSADITLYAKWTTADTYTVVYDGNGNTGGNEPIDTNNYESGGTITVLGNTGSLDRTGYAFVGWNTSSDGSGIDRAAGAAFSIDSADVTLYAKWTTALTYTVVYDGNGNTGGSVPADTNNYESGSTVTVLVNSGNLAKIGFSFAGWNTSSNGSGTDRAAGTTFSMGSADVTLYAKWTTNVTYTVVYDGNGNTGGNAPIDIVNYESAETVTVLSNSGNLIKTGHAFDGWNTSSDGSGTDRAAGATFSMGSADETLYAKWTIEWGYPDFRYYFPDEYLDYDYLSGGETAIVVESRNNVPGIHYGDAVSFDNLSDKSWLVSYNKANDPIYQSLDGNQGTSTIFQSSNYRKYPEETDKQYGSRIDSFLTFYTLDEISNPRIVITGDFSDGQILVSNDGNSYTLIWDSAADGPTIDLDINLQYGTRAIRFIYGETTWNDESKYLELNKLDIYEDGTDKLTLAKINPISVFYEYSDFKDLGDLTSSEIDPEDLLMENVLVWGQDDDIMEPFDDNPGILGLYTGISLMEAVKIANYKGQILKWLDYVDKMLGTHHQADSPWSGGTGPEYFNYVEKSQLSGIFVNCTPHDYQGGASGKGGLWSDWEDDTIWMSMDQKMAVSRPLAGQADLWDIGAHELLHSYEIGEIVRLGLNEDDGQTTVNGSGLSYYFYDHGYVYTTNFGQQFIFREEFSEPGLEVMEGLQSRFWDKNTKANLRFFNTVFYGDVFTDRDGLDFHPDTNRDGVDFGAGDDYASEAALFTDLYDYYYAIYVGQDFDMESADKTFSANLMKDEEFEFYYQTENDPAQFHRSVNQMLFRAWLAQFLENNNNYVGYSDGSYVDADRHQRLALYLSLLRNDFDVDNKVKASYLSMTVTDLETGLNDLYDFYTSFANYFAAQP